jgi:hypothetical protein
LRARVRQRALRVRRRVERAMGIEPTLSGWEPEVLPLNYARAARRFYGGCSGSGNFAPCNPPVQVRTSSSVAERESRGRMRSRIAAREHLRDRDACSPCRRPLGARPSDHGIQKAWNAMRAEETSRDSRKAHSGQSRPVEVRTSQAVFRRYHSAMCQMLWPGNAIGDTSYFLF